MNRILKTTLTLCLLVILLTFVTGCAQELTPYELNNSENYNVSVKFDAGSGIFTTNTSVIVDSYNVSSMTVGSDGLVQIPLIAPDNEARGNDAFTAINNGYFLAGWYTQRTQTDNGYVYGGKWDFENDLLAVDPGESHSSAEPIMTLYAAWIPLFEIEFCDLDGDTLGTYSFDPLSSGEILVPEWNEQTGAINMYKFPQKNGYTFECAYYDSALTQPVTGTVQHPGVVDEATGTASDRSLKLYVQWTEGNWYHIYNVEQFLDNASVNGSYVLHADLDFSGEIWPTSLMYGSFTGTIQGNGHRISNVEITQTNNSKANAGLFGHIAESACIAGLTLENVTFTIQKGTRTAGTSYGLFAGTVSDQAVIENVLITGSTLQVDSQCYFGTEDYVIGLVCGMGNPGIDSSGISVEAVGDNPEKVILTVSDDEVTVEIVN